MSIYLGNLGRLVELKSPSSQSVAADDGYSFETTLEGRVKAQARTARPRQWSVDIGAATPADLANLLAFAGGEWGTGPFVWVSADAPVTNMLTPEVSLCGPSAVYGTASAIGGPMVLGDGAMAGRSLVPTAPGSHVLIGAIRAAVVSGQPVTGSAWVIGNTSTYARLAWYDAAGNLISDTRGTPIRVAGDPRRATVTGVPPAGAAGCLLSIYGAQQIARPAVTWTDTVFDWQPGEGCPKAVIHGLSKQLILALRNPSYGRYSNASFTVTEMG